MGGSQQKAAFHLQMNFYGVVVVALILTTSALGAPSSDADSVIPEASFSEEVEQLPMAQETEMKMPQMIQVQKKKKAAKSKSNKAKKKDVKKASTTKDVRWKPDVTAPSSMKEWNKMWGAGADLTSEVKNKQSCHQRCEFDYKSTGADALSKCKDGCNIYSDVVDIVFKGKKCMSGSKECNDDLKKAENICNTKCEKIPSGPSAPKTKANDNARTPAGGHLPSVPPHKKLKVAANSADTTQEKAKLDLHFCTKGCERGASNICYQGSGECLNVPGLLIKFPRVGSCRTTSNKCAGNGSPTCSAENCIQTPEQCHSACSDWHTRAGAGEIAICQGQCPSA